MHDKYISQLQRKIGLTIGNRSNGQFKIYKMYFIIRNHKTILKTKDLIFLE